MGRGDRSNTADSRAATLRDTPTAEPIRIEDAIANRDDAFLLRALTDRRVRFVVVGGMAVRAYGSSLVTADLDITPARSRDNLDRLAVALNAMGAQRRRKNAEVGEPTLWTSGSLKGRRGVAMVTPYGVLDLAIVPQGTGGYRDLARNATQRTVAGLKVLVASNEDLQRMKKARNLPRDRAALIELRRLAKRK